MGGVMLCVCVAAIGRANKMLTPGKIELDASSGLEYIK